MLHFVMSYMKQNKSRKQTLESAQYGLEIIFKLDINMENCCSHIVNLWSICYFLWGVFLILLLSCSINLLVFNLECHSLANKMTAAS